MSLFSSVCTLCAWTYSTFSRIFNEEKRKETLLQSRTRICVYVHACPCVRVRLCACMCRACHFVLDSYAAVGASSAVKSTITVVCSVMTAQGRLVTALASDRHGRPSLCVCLCANTETALDPKHDQPPPPRTHGAPRKSARRLLKSQHTAAPRCPSGATVGVTACQHIEVT